MDRGTHLYDDIIHMPHHISKTRAQMPMRDRAAQFSSFDALAGFGGMIEETKRLTDKKLELDETEIERLDEKLNILSENILLHPKICVVYFLPDEWKDGGAYVTHIGSLKKIDRFLRTVIFTDGERIPIDDISSIDGELFAEYRSED